MRPPNVGKFLWLIFLIAILVPEFDYFKRKNNNVGESTPLEKKINFTVLYQIHSSARTNLKK
jgi:hypothetical protein